MGKIREMLVNLTIAFIKCLLLFKSLFLCKVGFSVLIEMKSKNESIYSWWIMKCVSACRLSWVNALRNKSSFIALVMMISELKICFSLTRLKMTSLKMTNWNCCWWFCSFNNFNCCSAIKIYSSLLCWVYWEIKKTLRDTILHRCHLMANNIMEHNCNIDADRHLSTSKWLLTEYSPFRKA